MITSLTIEWSKLSGTVYFSSDTHFFHKNILEYCPGRGFTDLDAMNKAIIAAHNSRVGPGDTYIHIGDFAMGQSSQWASILPQMNGTKLLVRGNHDGTHSKMQSIGFNTTCDSLRLVGTPHGSIWCEHVPHLKHDCDYHLCGHVHQRWETHKPRIINVGVDVNGLMPKTLSELVSKLNA